MPGADYAARVADQIAQYSEAKIHDLPPIYHYWSNAYVRPKLKAVLGVDSVPGFYAEHIRERAVRTGPRVARVLSIGAGDAELEVQIAQQLLAGGLSAFRLECLELSPILIERANGRLREAGLAAHVAMVQADLNSWSPDPSSGPVTAVLANHILHHVVELEALFANVARAIGGTGVFLTTDMIGRNGHLHWPEALTLVNALFETLPAAQRYNHRSLLTDNAYIDWDCCAEGGFEGIRAQDILPLLVERFRFEKFLGFGGLPDTFCDRVYGPNFDPEIPAHTRFIDSVEQLNSVLMELGVLKPTMMYAVMSNHDGPVTKVWKTLTPQFCLRNPGHLDLSGHRQKSPALTAAFQPTTLRFSQGASGCRALRDGWSHAEEWGTWMVGKEAVVELPVPAAARTFPALTVTFHATAFLPRRLHSRSFTFQVGDEVVGEFTFLRSGEMPRRLTVELETPASATILLRIVAHEEASPDEDGSPDHRKLGLALLDITVG